MHGGAVTLARRFMALPAEEKRPFLILATDMLDLTTFLSLTRPDTHDIPAGLYMHENQLTYPLPQDGRMGPMRRQKGERDYHYVFINYASMLAADFICFNSHYHQDSFFEALPRFLKHFPEYNELNTIALLQAKSQVLPVGVDFGRLALAPQPTRELPPLILWNQRWEYDKNPTMFFRALYAMAEAGLPFRLALCGQQYGKRPSIFDEAIERLGSHLIHVGYADAQRYRQLLWQATITLSTANHEFFGISILEAIYCHTFPLLPHQLSYPELIPEPHQADVFYKSESDLQERLRRVLQQPEQVREITAALAQAVNRYDWSHMAPHYDRVFAHYEPES